MAHHNNVFIKNSNVNTNKNSIFGLDAARPEAKKSSIVELMGKIGVTNGQFIQFVMVVLLIGAISALFAVSKIPYLAEKLSQIDSKPSVTTNTAPNPTAPSLKPEIQSGQNDQTGSIVPSSKQKVDFCASLGMSADFDHQIIVKSNCLRHYNGG